MAPTAPTSSIAAIRCGRCWPSWRSDPYARLIELPRFSPEELGEQLQGIVADRPDAELVERVYARSEGNALYTEEILAAGLDGRGRCRRRCATR